MKLFYLSALFFCLSKNYCTAQRCPEQKKTDYTCYPREFKSFGIEFYAYGPTLSAGYNMSFIVQPELDLHLGFGGFGMFLGGAYHFLQQSSHNRITPYIGIDLVYNGWYKGEYNASVNEDAEGSLYSPVGIQYISCSGFSVSAEIAATTNKLQYYFSGGLKVGYYFNR